MRKFIDARPSVKQALIALCSETEEALSLEDFLSGMDQRTFSELGPETLASRAEAIEQVSRALTGLYVHLPFKHSRYAANPVERLRVLARSLPDLTDLNFNTAMLEIFRDLHDPHTTYQLPEPFKSTRAFLPFLIELCYMTQGKLQPCFVVTRILNGFECEGLEVGSELTHWNGMPIDIAVENAAQRESGANHAARFAMAVAGLTVRSLRFVLAPDDPTVVLRFLSPEKAGEQRQEFEMLMEWSVMRKGSGQAKVPAGASIFTAPGTDFGAGYGAANKKTNNTQQSSRNPRCGDTHDMRTLLFKNALERELGWNSLLAGAVEYKLIQALIANRSEPVPVGVIRIRTFDRPNPAFVDEIAALVSKVMRKEAPLALILDIRGNSGGQIWNGEELLQLFTPGPITAAPFQFLNTPLIRHIANQSKTTKPSEVGVGAAETTEATNPFAGALELVANFTPILEDLSGFGLSQDTGALYSRAAPITLEPNGLGQKYYGRVALITDAMCYSTTDIFAAGFQDHRIGPVIGVDDSTGGGGANVWNYKEDLENRETDDGRKFLPLPNGADLGISVRHSMRVGRFSGDILEDFGVKPDFRCFLSKRDILSGNDDLYQFAASKVLTSSNLGEICLDVVVTIDDNADEQLPDERVPKGHCDFLVEFTAKGVQECEVVVNGKVQELVHASVDIDEEFVHRTTYRFGPTIRRPQEIVVNCFSNIPPADFIFYSAEERAAMSADATHVLVASAKLTPGLPNWVVGELPVQAIG